VALLHPTSCSLV